MEKVAFRMSLKPGCEDAYRRRHDAIWPELVDLLHESGIRNYCIYLDRASGALFAILSRTEDHGMDQLAQHPVMQRWWAAMADIMETAPDNSPVTIMLEPMFVLER